MMPFIIRAITLKGVESIYTSQKLKQEAWYSISKLVNKIKLKKLTTIIKLKEVESYSKKLLNSKIKGRIVVDLNNF